MSTRGIARERALRTLLEADDWWTCRAAGSLGNADVVALRAGSRPRLIEVKSTARGPFEHFPPRARAELRFAAELAGGDALLCWWPARSKPRWIYSSEWPS